MGSHPDLHVVVGVDEPGHVGWTLKDEHGGIGIPRSTAQLHLHGHCPGPVGRQTPTSEWAVVRGAGDGVWRVGA